MADILKQNQEGANPTDIPVAVLGAAVPLSAEEVIRPNDENVPFFGLMYGQQIDAEQNHTREELILFLVLHAPALGSGLVFVSPYNGLQPNLLMIAGGGSATHTDLYVPPVYISTLRDAQYGGGLFISSPYSAGTTLIMAAGLPTLDKETQLLYVSPIGGDLNLGNITQPTVTTITIYNASNQTQVLESLDLPDSFGLVFRDFIVGYNLTPQATVTFTVDVLMEGQNSVNANFFINTNIGRLTYKLQVTRSILILLNMEPNSGSYSEQYEFATKIFTSMTKKEARKVYREVPKRKVAYSVNIYDYQMYTYAKNLALYAMVEPTAVYQPLWLRATKLDVTTVAANVVLCDTVGREFQVGEYIIVQNKPNLNVNLVEITGVSDTQLTTKDPITSTKGADVVPVFKGYTGKSSGGSYKNGKVHAHSYSVEEFHNG